MIEFILDSIRDPMAIIIIVLLTAGMLTVYGSRRVEEN